MAKLATLLAVVSLFALLSAAPIPALAADGCGPHHHRSAKTGQCLWGGRKQEDCVRRTGQKGHRMPNGDIVCFG